MKPGAVKYTKGYAKKRFFKKIIHFFIVVAIFSIVATTLFVYYKQPIKTGDDYLLAEPSYEILQHGQKVLVSEEKNTNFLTPIKRFLFEQEAYYGKVVAGPYGKIQQVNGGYRVSDGTEIISVSVDSPPEYLDFQYIVRKIDDSGEEIKSEQDVILNKDEIVGKMIENN